VVVCLSNDSSSNDGSTRSPQTKVQTAKKPEDVQKPNSYPKPAEKFQVTFKAELANSEKQKDAYPKPDKRFQQSLKESVEKSEK
jgi:hypothetical protein